MCAAAGTDNAETIKNVMLKLTCDKAIDKQITLDTQDYTNNIEAMNEIAGSDYQLRVPRRPEPHRAVRQVR